MTSEILIAIITGLVSLIVAVLSGLISYRASIDKIRKEQNGQYLEALLANRLKSYPHLLLITQDLGKKTAYINGLKKTLTFKDQIQDRRKALIELRKWESQGEGFLILSKDSLSNYYKVKDELKKNPSSKTSFSAVQMKKLFQARNALRGSLREDIGVYHTADIESRI